MRNIVIVGAIVAVLGLAAWFVLSSQGKTNTSTVPTSTSSTQTATLAAQSVTITYDGTGFSPSPATVKSGGTVTIKNTSSIDLQFDSDPHPEHTSNPELNLGVVGAGQSQSFTVTTKGTFGYHNHLNASQRGTLIVQ